MWFLTVETVIRTVKSIIHAKDQLMLHGDRHHLFILWLTSNRRHCESKKDAGKSSEVGVDKQQVTSHEQHGAETWCVMEMRSFFIWLTLRSGSHVPGDISETFIEFTLSTSGEHTKTTEPEEVRRGSKQAYCSLPSEKRFHPHIAVMLQKSIPGCQTGQNAISVQSVREITLAEASATVPWDWSSPSARERRVNAFPTSLIPEQCGATSGHAIWNAR